MKKTENKREEMKIRRMGGNVKQIKKQRKKERRKEGRNKEDMGGTGSEEKSKNRK